MSLWPLVLTIIETLVLVVGVILMFYKRDFQIGIGLIICLLLNLVTCSLACLGVQAYFFTNSDMRTFPYKIYPLLCVPFSLAFAIVVLEKRLRHR
jgi:hypothetical protein